jgi:hypothetical protein
MKFKSALLAAFGLLVAQSCALAASTIDPAQPPLRGAFVSAPVRNNFLAAFTDVNNILGKFAGNTPPSSPLSFQEWADTTASPLVVFKYWNLTTSTWIPYASLNIATGVYSAFSTSASFIATPPITISVSGGVATFGLAKDSNFATVGGALAFAPIANGSLLARCTGSTGEPTACTWPNYAAQAIGATNGIFPHYVGGVWTTDTTGVSGHAVPFLDGTGNTWTNAQTVYPGSSGLAPAQAGTLLRAVNLDGVNTGSELDAYGATGVFIGLRADGTLASPSTLVTNDEILSLQAWGYDGAGYGGPAAAVRMRALGTWTNTSHPTQVCISTTAITTLTLTDNLCLQSDGSLVAPASVSGGSQGPNTLNIAGAIFDNGVAPTGTAGYVRKTGPTIAGLSVTGSFTATGLVTNADLTNSGLTLGSTLLTLGATITTVSGLTLASPTVTGAFTATNLVTFADMATAAIATQSNYFSGAASVLVPASQIYQPEITVTFGATTTFDFNTFINAVETLTGNVTTQTLSNVTAGKAGSITLIQDATGSRTSVFNSIFKFSGGVVPTLSTAANAIDVLFYSCRSATNCPASLVKDVR